MIQSFFMVMVQNEIEKDTTALINIYDFKYKKILSNVNVSSYSHTEELPSRRLFGNKDEQLFRHHVTGTLKCSYLLLL